MALQRLKETEERITRLEAGIQRLKENGRPTVEAERLLRLMRRPAERNKGGPSGTGGERTYQALRSDWSNQPKQSEYGVANQLLARADTPQSDHSRKCNSRGRRNHLAAFSSETNGPGLLSLS
jgi:hypothetical protein